MTSPDPKLLERILDEFQDLIILIDAKTFKVQYLNDKMAHSLGKTKQELLGKNFLKFFPPDVAQKRKEMALNVIQTKKPVFFEDQRLQRWFQNSCYPIFDNTGEVLYGLAIVQDITKQKQSDFDLKKSEERYKNLVNNLNDGVCTLDKKGNFIFVNDTIIRRSGISAKQWKHIDLYKLTYPEYHKKIDEALKLLFAGKKVPPFELAYKTANQKKIFVEVNARLHIEDNDNKKIHAITHDITDRKRTEDALKRSENKYRQLINRIQDAVFTLDTKGHVTYINNIAVERSGIPADKWSDIKFYQLADSEYQQIAKKNFEKVLNGEEVPPFEVVYRNKDKEKIIVELNTGPIYDENNKIIGIQGISRDITERKNALDALQKSEEMYRTLLQISPDPIVLTDLHGTVINVSHQSIQLFGGTSVKDLIGKNAFSFIPPDQLPIAEEIYKKTLENGFVKNAELTAFTKGKNRVFYEVSTGLLREKNGNPTGFFGIYRDITQRKIDETKLRESEKKYRQLIDLMQDAVFTLDNNGKVTYINKVGMERSGIPAQKWSNIKFYNIVPTKYLKLWNINFDKVLAGEQVPPFIVSYKSKYNQQIFVELNIGPLYDDGNNIIGVTGISRDVTDRTLAENQLKDTKNYLQTVIDSTSDIIFVIDLDKRLKTWNKTAERITGYKAKPILGKKFDSKDIFVDPSQIENIITNVIQHMSLDSHELSLNTVDGEHRLISFSSSLLKDAESRSNAVLFTGHDITEESRIHKRLKFGQGYLIIEDGSYDSNYLFENLLRDGDNGLYITRFPHHQAVSHFLDANITYAYLTKNKAFTHSSPPVESLDKLSSTITDFISTNRNPIVMLDRLDYLISLYSFEKVLQSIYQIHDEIHHHHGLFLVKSSRKILSDAQQALLFEELLPLPDKRIESIELSEKLFEILQFIEIRLSMNEQITFHKIEKSMHISKVTTRKRLLELENVDLISVKKRGRVKVIQLTHTGKVLLQKRKMV